MEKLIELLNEYSLRFIENKYLINWEIGENPIGIYGYVREYGLGWASKLIIISNEFGFIKWLVENDKINTKQLNLQVFKSIFSADGTVYVSYDEIVLMLLSISDEPIGLLIDMLK